MGWLLILVWSGYTTFGVFSDLTPHRRVLIVCSWFAIAAGLGALYLPFRVSAPLMGFGLAGLVFTLTGRYLSPPQRVVIPALALLVCGSAGATFAPDFFLSIPGPHVFATGAGYYFFLLGWLLLFTASSMTRVSLLRRGVFIASWLLVAYNFVRWYPNQDIWIEPAIVMLALTLPPPTDHLLKEKTTSALRFLGIVSSIIWIVGSILGLFYAILSAPWLIVIAMLAGAFGIVGLVGAYFRIRSLWLGVGTLFLAFCMFLFQGALFLGPVLLPLAISIFISGLLMPSNRGPYAFLRERLSFRYESPEHAT